MRITLKDVVEKANESPQNKSWVTEYKTRIKVVIKSNQLEEKVVRYLWHENTLRRPLVTNQKIPKDIILEIIDLTLANKKRKISSSVYKETLLKQEIEDKSIEDIWVVGLQNGRYEDVVTMVKAKTGQFVNLIGFGHIINKIISPGVLQLDYIISICSSLIQYNDDFLDDICQKFFDLKDIGWIHHSMTTFAKIAYFSDKLVDRLHQYTDDMSFYQIFQVLMSRDHCSPVVQAKYLLNR